MRFQANIGPSSHRIEGLRVFVSYKTEDVGQAIRLRQELEESGFLVTLFEPVDPEQAKDEAEIRSALRRSMLEADYMCLINSPEASSSPWIAYEIVQAAMILGRVCLVDTTGRGGQTAADRLLEAGRRFADKEGLHVKHTSVSCKAIGPRECEVIVSEILNSPDERWYDGTVPVPTAPLDLKRQSQLRKAVRARVHGDARFADQIIEEIIPYPIRDEAGMQRPPTEQQFTSLLFNDGRLPVLDRYRADDVEVLHARYRGGELAGDADVGLGAFVVVSRGFIGRRAPEIDHGTFTDPRDGKRYRTVTINGFTWMAENLRFESQGSWAYGDDPETAREYGRLYTWDAAMDACPDGWHVASMREWLTLAETFGGYCSNLDCRPEDAARAEESYQALVEEGTSGVEIRLAGFRDYFGNFKYLDVDGYYWSSTERDVRSAHILFFLGGAMETQHGWAYKIAGHSVRCVRGESVDWRPWR